MGHPSISKQYSLCPCQGLRLYFSQREKKEEDCALADLTPSAKCPRKSLAVCPPSEDELPKFYITLSECRSKPAILSVTLPYANDFQPQTSCSNFPSSLPELYKEEY